MEVRPAGGAGLKATPLTVPQRMLLDHARQAGPTLASPAWTARPRRPAACTAGRRSMTAASLRAHWHGRSL